MNTEPLTRVPVDEWTDDEWVAVMTKFPPHTNAFLSEQWVAERRRQPEAQGLRGELGTTTIKGEPPD